MTTAFLEDAVPTWTSKLWLRANWAIGKFAKLEEVVDVGELMSLGRQSQLVPVVRYIQLLTNREKTAVIDVAAFFYFLHIYSWFIYDDIFYTVFTNVRQTEIFMFAGHHSFT